MKVRACTDSFAIRERDQIHSLEVYIRIAYDHLISKLEQVYRRRYPRAKVTEVNGCPVFEARRELLTGIRWVLRRHQITVWECTGD